MRKNHKLSEGGKIKRAWRVLIEPFCISFLFSTSFRSPFLFFFSPFSLVFFLPLFFFFSINLHRRRSTRRKTKMLVVSTHRWLPLDLHSRAGSISALWITSPARVRSPAKGEHLLLVLPSLSPFPNSPRASFHIRFPKENPSRRQHTAANEKRAQRFEEAERISMARPYSPKTGDIK